MRPFFPFYGSKWNIARYYPKPLFSTVIEPFAGSAGYATFYNIRSVVLYEADPIIAGVWQYLTRVSGKEILSLPELPEVGDSTDNYDLPPEAKWLIGFWLNRGSAQPNWGAQAKERIAAQVDFIRDWRVTCGQYHEAPTNEATWFVDPPYVEKGKFYRLKFSDYRTLGAWCLSRQGQVIVCEGVGSNWLPFQPLGSFKSSKGRADERVFIK